MKNPCGPSHRRPGIALPSAALERKRKIDALRRRQMSQPTLVVQPPINHGPLPPLAESKNGIARILIPPGIGDIYWVLVKLEAFMLRQRITTTKLTIISNDVVWNAHLRSIPFLKMVPFVEIGTPECIPNDIAGRRTPADDAIYKEAYRQPGRTAFPGFKGYDYFMSYNGTINSGRWLEETDTDLECNWYLPLIVSAEQERFQKECVERFGNYVVFHWTLAGDYLNWVAKEFPINNIATAIQQFVKKYNVRAVFAGAHWDTKWNDMLPSIIRAVPDAVDMCGQTTIDQAFGLLKGSKMVVGYHDGLMNMSAMFKKKTLLLWCEDQFPYSVPMAVVPPETRGTTYRPLYTKTLTIDKFVGKMGELYES